MEGITKKLILMYLGKMYDVSNKGRPDKWSHSSYLEQIWIVLKTGIQWRYLKGEGHWSTYHKKFIKWCKNGVFENCYRILAKLLEQHQHLDVKDLYIDSTMIKNVRGQDCTGINHYDRGRKGSKATLVVTRDGIPLGLSMVSQS